MGPVSLHFGGAKVMLLSDWNVYGTNTMINLAARQLLWRLKSSSILVITIVEIFVVLSLSANCFDIDLCEFIVGFYYKIPKFYNCMESSCWPYLHYNSFSIFNPSVVLCGIIYQLNWKLANKPLAVLFFLFIKYCIIAIFDCMKLVFE